MEGGWRVGGGWMDEGAEGRMDGRRTDGWMDGAWGMGHGAWGSILPGGPNKQ